MLRVLLDGVGARPLSNALVPGLAAAGRAPVQVSAQDFLRPAGERYEWGREDAEAFRTTWLDAAALDREVLSREDGYLPALWDADADRSARRAVEPVPPGAVLLVDGVLLLGRGLPAEVTVHLAVSPAALLRRGVPPWQLPAFDAYDRQVRPGHACDVLIRAEDPLRPVLRVRGG